MTHNYLISTKCKRKEFCIFGETILMKLNNSNKILVSTGKNVKLRRTRKLRNKKFKKGQYNEQVVK